MGSFPLAGNSGEDEYNESHAVWKLGLAAVAATAAVGDEWNISTNGTDLHREIGEKYVPYIERPETYIVPVLFAIIFIIGVLGNGTLILIFLRHRTMRNVPNMYICSLAVGDILVIFFCVPFTSTVYTVESWPYGLLVCKFSEFIKDVSIGVSVFTLTALSADRYFAIVDPMRKLTGCRATRITCVTIVAIWIVSIIIALPSVLFSYIRVIADDPTHTFQVCYPFPPELGLTYPKVMVMFKFLVYYAIPLAFIAFFYIIMAQHLILSTKNMPGEAAQGQTKQIQARKKVAKMVLSFVVIFAICFFPSHVFLLWFYFDPNSLENFNAFWNLVRIIGFCLGFINSCINPITLYCLSGTFRKHFNNNLCCCSRDRGRDGRDRAGRNLFGCGCVSMSNSAPMYGGGGEGYRKGSANARNGGAGLALYRASTVTNSGAAKRRCTWESPQQSAVSAHHRHILSMNTGSTTAGILARHQIPLQQYQRSDPTGGADVGIAVNGGGGGEVTALPLKLLQNNTGIPMIHGSGGGDACVNENDSSPPLAQHQVFAEDITMMTSFIHNPITLANLQDHCVLDERK